jgi:hypothetical protein
LLADLEKLSTVNDRNVIPQRFDVYISTSEGRGSGLTGGIDTDISALSEKDTRGAALSLPTVPLSWMCSPAFFASLGHSY